MSELKATSRLEKYLTVAGLVAVFYWYWPFGILKGIGLYVGYVFVLAFLKVIWMLLKRLLWAVGWDNILAFFTGPFFRPWSYSLPFGVSPDRLLLVGDSLYYNGKPVYCSVQLYSWRYYLAESRVVVLQKIKGEYHLLLGKSI